ncbi:hypothetical protein VitviT2T_017263 [Vitis vinifera]|uniref:Uncharacterized protein n=1 Tax=Vitis vinifera TaxID=29760 RepID=A0ABY9CVP7_VITVI|nr:hypothetical protein VitviT2T_017263 [Vitis vinifera]
MSLAGDMKTRLIGQGDWRSSWFCDRRYSDRVQDELNLQCTHDLSTGAVISSDGLSGWAEIRWCVSKSDGGGQRTYVQGQAIVQKDRWNSAT